jgi:hypothetical protein
MRVQRWQDVASLLVGIWLIFSPWALGLAGPDGWLSAVVGLFVILFAIEGLLVPSYLEQWGEIALGLLLVVAPLVMQHESAVSGISSLVSGALVVLFAVWELLTDAEFMAWWREHVRRA